MAALALPEEDRTPVDVRGVGRVLVANPLHPVRARALLRDQANPELGDAEFRDRWLTAVTDVDDAALVELSETLRHRLALAVLRVRGLERDWRRLYGSPGAPVSRLRRLVGEDLRRQVPRASPERYPAEGSVINLAQFRGASEALTRGLRPSMDRISEAVMAPLRSVIERIQQIFRPALDGLRRGADQFVRRPAFTQALRVVDAHQRRVAEAIRPVEALLRSRDDILRRILTRARAAPLRQDEIIDIPDAASLATFYGQERADPDWRTSEVGWLLAAVPLSVGAVLHERFGVSPVVGLAWIAERFARREMRRRLLRAIDGLSCSDSLRQRLHDGADLFFREHYHSADSLLTAGLDGLLFEFAERVGVLSARKRLIRNGKATGSPIKTAADSRLLHALGFNPSQKD